MMRRSFLALSVPLKEGLLRLAVLGWCLGMFVYLRGGSTLGGYFFMTLGWSHDKSVLVEHLAAWTLLAAGISVILYPIRSVLLALSLVSIFYAWTAMEQGGAPFSQFSLASSALRIATPLFLAGWIMLPETDRNQVPVGGAGRWIVRFIVLMCAITFFAHGVEAFRAHPGFIDMTLSFFRELTGWSMSESTAIGFLRIVGLVDIAIAIVILFWWHPGLFLWMAFWGGFTALLRTIELGPGVYVEVLLRFPHFFVPLVLFLWVRNGGWRMVNGG